MRNLPRKHLTSVIYIRSQFALKLWHCKPVFIFKITPCGKHVRKHCKMCQTSNRRPVCMDHMKISNVSIEPALMISPLLSNAKQENWHGRGAVNVRKLRYLNNVKIIIIMSYWTLYWTIMSSKTISRRARSPEKHLLRANTSYIVYVKIIALCSDFNNK